MHDGTEGKPVSPARAEVFDGHILCIREGKCGSISQDNYTELPVTQQSNDAGRYYILSSHFYDSLLMTATILGSKIQYTDSLGIH